MEPKYELTLGHKEIDLVADLSLIINDAPNNMTPPQLTSCGKQLHGCIAWHTEKKEIDMWLVDKIVHYPHTMNRIETLQIIGACQVAGWKAEKVSCDG